MFERTHQYRNLKITDDQFENLLSQVPEKLQVVFRRLPRSAALTYVDFAKNKYAVGSFAGSILASLLVIPLDKIGVSRDWIYAISGVIAEHATALAFGVYSGNQDPYKTFLKDLESMKA